MIRLLGHCCLDAIICGIFRCLILNFLPISQCPLPSRMFDPKGSKEMNLNFRSGE